MYVAEGEKVPDDCILCDHIYCLRLFFVVSVDGFDSLPMATAADRGLLSRDLKMHSTRKEEMINRLNFTYELDHLYLLVDSDITLHC